MASEVTQGIWLVFMPAFESHVESRSHPSLY